MFSRLFVPLSVGFGMGLVSRVTLLEYVKFVTRDGYLFLEFEKEIKIHIATKKIVV